MAIFTGHERFPQRKLRWGERGGIYAFCPNEKRLLSQDETRRMALSPGRIVCSYCGAFVFRNAIENPFG